MSFLYKFYSTLFVGFFVIVTPLHLSAKTVISLKDSLLNTYKSIKSDTERVKVLLQLSNLTNCDDSINKVRFVQSAEAIARKTGWAKGELEANIALGQFYFNCTKQYEISISFFSKNLSISQNTNDTFSLVFAMESIAKNYEKLGHHDQSLFHLSKGLSLNANPALNMGILGDMGVIYNSIGDYRQALICYNRSLAILDSQMHTNHKAQQLDTLTRGGLLLNIGDIYLSMSQTEKALENYNSGLKLGIALKDDFLKCFSALGIGKAYYFKKSYTEAIKNFEVALVGSRSLKEPMYEAGILDQLANVHIATGDIGKAEQYAEASLKIAESNGFNEQLPKTYTTLGKLLSLRGNHSVAVNYLQKALGYCHQAKALEDEKNVWEALSNVYKKMQLPAKALEAFEHFISLRDSVYSIDKANELVRIDLQAGFNKKQVADSLSQAAKYELKMQKQQVLTYSGFVGLVLVLLLSFFIYRNYHTQKKYNQLLSKEKERHLQHIEAQSNVLTDIAYTQSHEIRGPVSTLLGLVEIFNYDDPADPENKEVLEGIASVTKRLDKIVTEVVNKENIVHNKGKES